MWITAAQNGGFPPITVLCCTRWLDAIWWSEVRKVFFFVLLSKSPRLGALSTFHQGLNCLLLYFSTTKCWRCLIWLFFKCCRKYFVLELRRRSVKLQKPKFKFLSSINALIYFGILTYIASHGLASSYLGDLLGFLKFLLRFELCFRQSPVVLSMMGYVHWGRLLASLHPSSEELLHPTHICWDNHSISIKTMSQRF